jgi:2-succinyl-5-enolpyruvyl-6-hydroxy-3-cyclohexene-1-carboxylate synthase
LHLLTTPHEDEFTPCLKALGVESKQITTKDEYQMALEQWQSSPQLQFLEVLVEDENNSNLYDQLKTVKL